MRPTAASTARPTRSPSPPSASALLQVLQRAAAHGRELGRSEAPASRAAAEVREWRRLDGVLDDRLRSLQVRQEQGKGGRVHQGADLRPADLEGFDRRHAGASIPANCRPTSRSTRVERQQAGLDAAVRLAGARPARHGQGHRQQPLRPTAVRDRQADLGNLPEGRGGRSEGRDAEGRRCGPGRDEEGLSRPEARTAAARAAAFRAILNGLRGEVPTHCVLDGVASTRNDRGSRSGLSGKRTFDRAGLAGAARRQRHVALAAAGAALLRRLSGLADLSASLWISFTDFQFLSNEPAHWVWLRQLCKALERPADVDEPVAGGAVHDHVPAGNDHPSAAPGDPDRPGDQSAHSRPSTGSSCSFRRSSRARWSSCCGSGCTITRRPDQSLPRRHARPVHRPQRTAMARRHGADAALDRDHGGVVGPRLPHDLLPRRPRRHPEGSARRRAHRRRQRVAGVLARDPAAARADHDDPRRAALRHGDGGDRRISDLRRLQPRLRRPIPGRSSCTIRRSSSACGARATPPPSA